MQNNTTKKPLNHNRMKTFFKRLFCKHIWKKSLSFYNGCERITVSVCEKCKKRVNNL